MHLTKFLKHFDTEPKAIEFIRQEREKHGIKCVSCGCTRLHWISTRLLWTCASCSYRLGLRKGTVMENSKLPYRIWLTCMYLMTHTKKGYSALEMQRLLGLKRYEPVWLMMHKIRISMGNRDANYLLDGVVEFDDAFFAGHRKPLDEFTGNPAKEVERNEKVLVAVSKNDNNARFLKMTVVQTLKTVEINYELPKMLSKSAVVITDGRRSYKGIKEHAFKHTVHIIKNKKEVCKTFPWVHTAISNAKKKLNGIHHSVKNVYMQNYLNEFAYKFNRRFYGQDLFGRLIVAGLSSAWFSSV